MRSQLSLLALGFSCGLALPAAADSLSAEIASSGIAKTRDRLAALASPSDAELFGLGGLTFLGAVETALQERYKLRLSPQLEMLPVLRLPVPENPNPEPFRPESIAEILGAVVEQMGQAYDVLGQIPESSDYGVILRLSDLWFDIDADGARGEGEDLLDVAAELFRGTGFDRDFGERVEIRFDVADSRWLAAYAQLIRGVSLSVLAYDPTEAITEVMQTKTALAELNGTSPMANAIDYMVGDYVDSFGTVLLALRSEPDAARGAEALAAFETVIAENRAFWRLVAAETDNAAEWIPNDAQSSALGLRFPEGTSESWQAVLNDAEKLLKGEVLLPYWRLGEDLGLNLRKMFLEPRAVDPVTWVLGSAALPYAERGPRISSESLWAFDRLMQGQGLLFAAILN